MWLMPADGINSDNYITKSQNIEAKNEVFIYQKTSCQCVLTEVLIKYIGSIKIALLPRCVATDFVLMPGYFNTQLHSCIKISYKPLTVNL